jgi:hypothetical protein
MKLGLLVLLGKMYYHLEHTPLLGFNRRFLPADLQLSLLNFMSYGILYELEVSSHMDRRVLLPRPPLWSSGQSSWLQIRKSGFDSRRYQIFREVVGLERGPLGLVNRIEELLERKSIGSGIENR